MVQEVTDRTGKEMTSADIWALFQETYLGGDGISLVDYTLLPEPRPGERRIVATIARRRRRAADRGGRQRADRRLCRRAAAAIAASR